MARPKTVTKLETGRTLYEAVCQEIEEQGLAPLYSIGTNPVTWDELPPDTRTFFAHVAQRVVTP